MILQSDVTVHAWSRMAVMSVGDAGQRASREPLAVSLRAVLDEAPTSTWSSLAGLKPDDGYCGTLMHLFSVKTPHCNLESKYPERLA